MKIIYMGTPEFANTILKSLIDSKHEVVLVVSNPDKSQGRHKTLIPSPVSQTAIDNNIELFRPAKIKDLESLNKISNTNADIIIVAAYGHILPKDIIFNKKFDTLNVHASVLPKYRGSSPIQAAMMNGDKFTGNTIMKMDEKMDTGNILMTSKVEIKPDDNITTLTDNLAVDGAKLLLETLDKIEDGTIEEIVQDENLATYTKMITKEDGHIDFANGAKHIICQIKAYNPWPKTYAILKEQKVIIGESKIAENIEEVIDTKIEYKPGDIATSKDRIFVKATDVFVEIKELQMPSKKMTKASDFLKGNEIKGRFE